MRACFAVVGVKSPQNWSKILRICEALFATITRSTTANWAKLGHIVGRRTHDYPHGKPSALVFVKIAAGAVCLLWLVFAFRGCVYTALIASLFFSLAFLRSRLLRIAPYNPATMKSDKAISHAEEPRWNSSPRRTEQVSLPFPFAPHGRDLGEGNPREMGAYCRLRIEWMLLEAPIHSGARPWGLHAWPAAQEWHKR